MNKRPFLTAMLAGSMILIATDISQRRKPNGAVIESYMTGVLSDARKESASIRSVFDSYTLSDKTVCEFQHSDGLTKLTVMPVVIHNGGQTTGLVRQTYEIQSGLNQEKFVAPELYQISGSSTSQDISRATECLYGFANQIKSDLLYNNSNNGAQPVPKK